MKQIQQMLQCILEAIKRRLRKTFNLKKTENICYINWTKHVSKAECKLQQKQGANINRKKIFVIGNGNVSCPSVVSMLIGQEVESTGVINTLFLNQAL